MNKSNSKTKKLVEMARLYYEQDKTQSEIAKIFNISRPLVSRMLKEAKEAGIVRIEICSPIEGNALILKQLRSIADLDGGIILPRKGNDGTTNGALANAIIEYVKNLNGSVLGIGWGTLIGQIVATLEKEEPVSQLAKKVCPLLGNNEISARNYHSNELVRVFGQHTQCTPIYLYAPAFVENQQEQQRVMALENYKNVYACWENMDIALVNIGNHPSTPDFASVARYGDILSKQKAVGRLLAYYFDAQGHMLQSDVDFSIMIPLKLLASTKHVIGLCSSHTKPKVLLGALRTGMLNHIVAPEEVVKAAIEIN